MLRTGIFVVRELNDDVRISLEAKATCLTVMFKPILSLRDLGKYVNRSAKYVSRLCKSLVDAGWMRLEKYGRAQRPVALIPREAETRIAREIEETLSLAPYKGEAVTRFAVDWIVSPAEKVIFNARPEYLANNTGERMEYDIYIPIRRWAMEFHGEQHFGPTTLYPGEKSFIDRFRRDNLKARISAKMDVELCVITKDELSLSQIDSILPDRVPRRVYDLNGPVAVLINKMAEKVGFREYKSRR